MIQRKPDLETQHFRFWVMKHEDVPKDVVTFSHTRLPGVVLVFAKKERHSNEQEIRTVA